MNAQVASGEREKFHVTNHTFCQNDKSYELIKVTYRLILVNAQVHKSSKWRERNQILSLITHFV